MARNSNSSTAATTITSPISTGKKVKLKRADESDSSPTESTVSSSSTSAGISTSVLLDDGPDDVDLQRASEKVEARIESGGQISPRGWTYHNEPGTKLSNLDFHPEGELISPRMVTPTRDNIAQTSRRPTLNIYECKYGYHFPTTPTSSMISDLAKEVQKASIAAPAVSKTKQVGYSKNKLTILSSEDEQLKRLDEMFPTATQPVIEQIIRIYHGREGLIKAALISLGYKRANEYLTQKSTVHSPVMLMMSKASSKKLFEKLVSYFPDKDEEFIKGLMYRHKEIEHEIISALVESSQEEHIAKCSQTQQDNFKVDKNGAIMKLRYLKFLYPSCEEIELYHLLHCHDLNAQKVMEVVEKRGHKRVNIEEVLQTRKTQTQQIRAQQQAHSVKDKAPSGAHELLEAHEKRPKPSITEARLTNLKENLKKVFGSLDDGLLAGALEATDYNEALARKFLGEMEPIDDAHYKQRYELPSIIEPEVVAYPCKAIQKGDTSFMSIVANEFVCITRKVIECENALALLKVDASTFTQEDFPKQKSTHRLGKKLELASGSIYKIEGKVRETLCKRSKAPTICNGSKYNEIRLEESRKDLKNRAIGCNKTLIVGSNKTLKAGHNSKLLERTHPFYKPEICN